MQEELKKEGEDGSDGRRVFGVVCKGHPSDFQLWLEAAKSYDVYIIFSKSTRVGRLVLKEEAW